MTVFTFANNINTTLAGAVSPTATTITLASTANLPASIPAGEVLVITLNDVATRQNFEIVYATARTGATLTVLRAQEGTAALSWLTGDYAYSPPTAGQMASLTPLSHMGVTGFASNIATSTSVTASTTFTPPCNGIITINGNAGAGVTMTNVTLTVSGATQIVENLNFGGTGPATGVISAIFSVTAGTAVTVSANVTAISSSLTNIGFNYVLIPTS
jgi:hypothetical protein